MKDDTKSKLHTAISIAVTGLVELFTGAVVNSVMSKVDGNKFTRYGAKIGGILVGLFVGDKVSGYVCDEVDTFMDGLEDIKKTIEEE